MEILNDTQSDEDVFSGFTVKELIKAIESLPDMYRTIFNMREVEGYDYCEIADALNMTESYARVCLARAKNMLRKKLEKHFVWKKYFKKTRKCVAKQVQMCLKIVRP